MILTALGLIASCISSSTLAQPNMSGFNSAGIGSFTYGNGFYTSFTIDHIQDANEEQFFITDNTTSNTYAFFETRLTYDSSTPIQLWAPYKESYMDFINANNFTCFVIARTYNLNTLTNTYYTKNLDLFDVSQTSNYTRYKWYAYTDTAFESPYAYVPLASGTTGVVIAFYWTFKANQSDLYYEGYDVGYAVGHQDGIVDGYDSAYQEGYTYGHADGESNGYSIGYNEALDTFNESNEVFVSSVASVLEVGLLPVNIFMTLLDIEVFGINIGAFVSSLITIVVITILLRTLFGGKGGKDE